MRMMRCRDGPQAVHKTQCNADGDVMLRMTKIIGALLLGIAALVAWRTWLRPDAAPIERMELRTTASKSADTAAREAPEPFTFENALKIAEVGLQNLDQNVVDYSARMIKQERVGDKLTDPAELFVKIQNPGRDENGEPLRPLRVYLQFLNPNAGREVIWGEDLFDKKLVVHEGGFMNLMRLSLDPDGMVAMNGNRYPVYRIGLAYLTEELLRRGREAPKDIDLRITTQVDHRIGDRDCLLIRIECPADRKELEFAQIDIAVDQENQIPLHYASYDWPDKPDEPLKLIESYTYYDVKLNPGYQDIDFSPDNPEYKFP